MRPPEYCLVLNDEHKGFMIDFVVNSLWVRCPRSAKDFLEMVKEGAGQYSMTVKFSSITQTVKMFILGLKI